MDGSVTGYQSDVENPGFETARGGASTPADDWIDHPSSSERRDGVPSNAVATPDEATAVAIAAPRMTPATTTTATTIRSRRLDIVHSSK